VVARFVAVAQRAGLDALSCGGRTTDESRPERQPDEVVNAAVTPDPDSSDAELSPTSERPKIQPPTSPSEAIEPAMDVQAGSPVAGTTVVGSRAAEPAANDIEPPPVSTQDPVFDNPNLSPGVTDVVQPSYFYAPDDETDPVTVTTIGDMDGGAADAGALSGTGDLTMLVVFDKSSSMLFDWDGKTRWQVANESLRAALDGILDVLTIGVVRFPLEELCFVPEFDSGAQVEFTTGREFVSIWQEMEHRLESLGTPLGNALSVADRAIAQASEEGRLGERFRVMLITDGEPTCDENLDAMTHMVATWHDRGVETLVLGLPGTEDAKVILDALAAAGGTGAVTMTQTAEELDDEIYRAVR
jgi:hypothetical protein